MLHYRLHPRHITTSSQSVPTPPTSTPPQSPSPCSSFSFVPHPPLLLLLPLSSSSSSSCPPRHHRSGRPFTDHPPATGDRRILPIVDDRRPFATAHVSVKRHTALVCMRSTTNSSSSSQPNKPSSLPEATSQPPTAPAPPPRRRTRAKQPAGGRGPLSADFLSVSGTLATLFAGVTLLLCAFFLLYLRSTTPIPTTTTTSTDILFPLTTTSTTTSTVTTPFSNPPSQSPPSPSLPLPLSVARRRALLALLSFAQGLLLSRFDLGRCLTLRLTLASTLLLRAIAMPVISHVVAMASFSLARLLPWLFSPSFSSSSLSSLFLLSTTPVVLSPSLTQLMPHVHATLLALLLALSYLLFPLLPLLSHAASTWAQANVVFNVGAVLPVITPAPPAPWMLALVTTLPFGLGLWLSRGGGGRGGGIVGGGGGKDSDKDNSSGITGTSRIHVPLLSPRAAATAALCALPIAWLSSWCLMLDAALHATMNTTPTNTTMAVAHAWWSSLPLSLPAFQFSLYPQLLAAALLVGGVSVAMFFLARLLAKVLLLKGRARRTLILFLCTPGVSVAAGVAAECVDQAPFAVAALLATVATALLARAWSHVVIRTSDDVN